LILNHKYKFIFIRTGKTAGTSVECYLSQFCGDKDVISPLYEDEEKIKKKLNLRNAQNYEKKYYSLSLKFLGNFVKDFFTKKIKSFKKKHIFYDHSSISEINKYFEKGIVKNYIKFCIVRNPYSFLISQFYWHNLKKNKIYKNDESIQEIKRNFDEYVKSCSKNFYYQKKIIENQQDEYGIDKYLYYENLESELENLIKELKIKEKPKYLLKDFKLKKQKNTYKIKKLLDKKNIDIIYNEANFFFKKFNYSKLPPPELVWEE
tara:strand:+ start:349 stop:1134 length:786 start_codon:yes stop_codon:yes gene_type:complete